MFIMLFGLLLMQLSQLSAEIRMGDMLVLGATVLWNNISQCLYPTLLINSKCLVYRILELVP